jgi:predicted MFS family arabinose efflux permease
VLYVLITLASFVAAPIAGALLSRVHARAMLSVGLAGLGAGLLLMGGIDAGSDWTTLLGGFLIAGAATGLLNPVIAVVAVSVVPKQQSGIAAGINDTFRWRGRSPLAAGVPADSLPSVISAYPDKPQRHPGAPRRNDRTASPVHDG